jgi:hypothetical protein
MKSATTRSNARSVEMRGLDRLQLFTGEWRSELYEDEDGEMHTRCIGGSDYQSGPSLSNNMIHVVADCEAAFFADRLNGFVKMEEDKQSGFFEPRVFLVRNGEPVKLKAWHYYRIHVPKGLHLMGLVNEKGAKHDGV